MRTTLDLPKELLQKAQKASRARTKTETIILGLRELLRKEKLGQLQLLRGKFPLAIDLFASRERA